MATRLGYQTTIALEPAAVRTYRETLGEVPMGEAHRRLLEALVGAEAVTTSLDLEAWRVEEPELGHRMIAHVVRPSPTEVLVRSISLRPLDVPTLGGCEVTHAALERYAHTRRRSVDADTATEELRVLLWLASPRALDARPESWRARGRGVDASLLVQRLGDDVDSPRLVIMAAARSR